ncbi:transposable element-derived 1-like [Octopus vulgaris]|uniref:Transposable element-derived 1-like n=1 Tax=Octopus vulgaris TaxID=6645 RepID=A0AA36EYG1_OCTVU|nr:transposable element-derived 1-like [Octopus vulgaris]
MAPKRAAFSKAGTEPKRKRRMMMIAEKVKLLDMLKEGKTFATVARHFSVNESTVRYIKRDEANIRKTAAITFDMSAKRVVMARNKTIISMEAALALWKADCQKKNIALDTNIIQTKARSLYETFTVKEPEDGSGDHEEEEKEEDGVEDPQPAQHTYDLEEGKYEIVASRSFKGH